MTKPPLPIPSVEPSDGMTTIPVTVKSAAPVGPVKVIASFTPTPRSAAVTRPNAISSSAAGKPSAAQVWSRPPRIESNPITGVVVSAARAVVPA